HAEMGLRVEISNFYVNLQPLSVELGPGTLGNIFDEALKTIARISHDVYLSQLLTRIYSGNSSQRKLAREILSLVEIYMLLFFRPV
ncbi:hypothetical protein Tco_0873036, partial [Tanacetum coccineum]